MLRATRTSSLNWHSDSSLTYSKVISLTHVIGSSTILVVLRQRIPIFVSDLNSSKDSKDSSWVISSYCSYTRSFRVPSKLIFHIHEKAYSFIFSEMSRHLLAIQETICSSHWHLLEINRFKLVDSVHHPLRLLNMLEKCRSVTETS